MRLENVCPQVCSKKRRMFDTPISTFALSPIVKFHEALSSVTSKLYYNIYIYINAFATRETYLDSTDVLLCNQFL